MNSLPQEFLDRMKDMLKDEYGAFLESYQQPRQYGLRVNTLKTTCEKFQEQAPFPVVPVPWITNGYFYPSQIRPADMPFIRQDFIICRNPAP